ncbi:hypothetical protein BV898_19914, partial [Hypsibius exemplaris]
VVKKRTLMVKADRLVDRGQQYFFEKIPRGIRRRSLFHGRKKYRIMATNPFRLAPNTKAKNSVRLVDVRNSASAQQSISSRKDAHIMKSTAEAAGYLLDFLARFTALKATFLGAFATQDHRKGEKPSSRRHASRRKSADGSLRKRKVRHEETPDEVD